VKPTDAHKKGEWGVEPWIHPGTIGEFCQPWLFGCWNCGFASKGAGNSQVEKKMKDGWLF